MTRALDALRADLAGFTVDALRNLWGVEADAALARGVRVPARRALDRAPDSALSTLARLFLLGLPASEEAAVTALPTLGSAGAVELGLLAIDDGVARPLLDLRPYSFVDAAGAGEWWLVSDLGELALGSALPEGHVLGVGGASLTLAGLQLDGPVGRVLDLGTGSGIQALHASRAAELVVATDISARAVELAAFNAELNGIQLDVRLGSLFEPVAGERFDRVVSNPPFVITPRMPGVPAYEYRDGGMVGDGIVEAVVRGLPDVLVEGGTAQLLGNWEYRGRAAGLDRVRSWVDDAGLDAWVVERERQDPAQYAETWIRDGGTRQGSAEFDRLLEAWLDDFDARGVTAVGFGYLLLRKPAASAGVTLRRFEVVPETLGANPDGLGQHLAAALDGHDWQVARDDSALLAARLQVAPDVTEQRHLWPGDEHPAAMDLRQGGGFGRTMPLDTALAGFVGAARGRRERTQRGAAAEGAPSARRRDAHPRLRLIA
jgi:SAM-dependent methyltransferase